MLDLEQVNDKLVAKVANHRALILRLSKMKNEDVYDKRSRCRLCGKTVKSRKLEDHAHPCLYVLAHHVPKTNRDLKAMTWRKIHVRLSRLKPEPSWVERIVLQGLVWMDKIDHYRTVDAMVKWLELHGFIVYGVRKNARS